MAKKLAKLSKIHYDAMQMRLNGSTIKEIAKALNKSEAAVRDWFYRDELFKQEFEKIKEESIERAKEVLINAAPEAAKRLVQLMYQQRGGQVNLQAANSILDRIGLKEIKTNVDGNGKTVLDKFMDKLLSEISEEDKINGDE